MDNKIPTPLKNEPGADLYQKPHQVPSFAPQNESGSVLTSLVLGHKFLQNSLKLSRSQTTDSMELHQVPAALSYLQGHGSAPRQRRAGCWRARGCSPQHLQPGHHISNSTQPQAAPSLPQHDGVNEPRRGSVNSALPLTVPDKVPSNSSSLVEDLVTSECLTSPLPLITAVSSFVLSVVWLPINF